jgi:hypothetical protein
MAENFLKVCSVGVETVAGASLHQLGGSHGSTGQKKVAAA